MKQNISIRKTIEYVSLAIFVGIFTGVLTLIGQKYLPTNLNFSANSVSMWLVPAFLLPYYLKENKICSTSLSVIVLILCVLSYYVFEAIYNKHSFYINGIQLFWLSSAVVGGIVFGLCSNLAQNKTNFIKHISTNMMPAVFVTEASSKLFHFNDYKHMVYGIFIQITIGIVLYLIINKKDAFKLKNALSFLVLIILGSIAFEGYIRVLSLPL